MSDDQRGSEQRRRQREPFGKLCMHLRSSAWRSGDDHRGGDQRAPPGGAFVLTAFDGTRGARAKAVKKNVRSLLAGSSRTMHRQRRATNGTRHASCLLRPSGSLKRGEGTRQHLSGTLGSLDSRPAAARTGRRERAEQSTLRDPKEPRRRPTTAGPRSATLGSEALAAEGGSVPRLQAAPREPCPGGSRGLAPRRGLGRTGRLRRGGGLRSRRRLGRAR